jgi:ABC-type sugar transport system ATPase subunit
VTTLEVRGVQKNYGETLALRGLALSARAGEVLGIAGPNGAGKSTLMRILGGEETPDAGEILLDGAPWSVADRRGSVATVHQEPQLFPNLTVTENLLLKRGSSGRLRPRATGRERQVLSELNLQRVADRPLELCSLVVWQLTEIGRALLRDARLFLFDEPNSALTDEESEQLFGHILRMREETNRIVILVSHRLRELVHYCDRVAVVREGACGAILAGTALTEEGLARELVVGHEPGSLEIGNAVAANRRERDEVLLRLAGWTHGRRRFRDVEVVLRPGEILTVMGVEGSGARELLQSIAGLEPAHGVREVAGRRNANAIDDVLAYVPADRRTGLFPNFSIAANLTSRLGIPAVASRWGRLLTARMYALGRKLMTQFQIKGRSPRQPVGALSGGNQQKVAVGSASAKRPRLVVIEEPTRGVDLGTKAEIYHQLREFAREGNAVLAYCTEVPEVFDFAQRVRVMSRGYLSEPFEVATAASVQDLASQLAKMTESGPRSSQARRLE